MLRESKAFSGFSVDDITKAKLFYEEVLGLDIDSEGGMGDTMFGLKLATGGTVMIYAKDSHQPATYTVLNFPVNDIDAAVDELFDSGVVFERYEGFDQDSKGIARSDSPDRGPNIAWFKDPAGNILSVLQ